MGLVGLALEFGVELAGEKERMARHLNQLDELVIGGGAAEDIAGFLKSGAVGVVEFVAVAVAFVGDKGAIEAAGLGTDGQLAGLETQAHGAAFAGDVFLVVEQGDDGMGSFGIEFGGVVIEV